MTTIKNLIGVIAAIAIIGIGSATNHEDIIYGVYNASCIETANYQYVFINCPDGESLNNGWTGVNIWLENIKEIGDKTFSADLYYID